MTDFFGGYRGPAIVAFVDLLGFSKALADGWGTEHDVLPAILKLKSEFDEYRVRPGRVAIDGRPDLKFDTHLNHVSDSFVLTCGVPIPNNSLVLLTSLLNIWGSFVAVSSYAARNGFAVRGAVEFGEVFIKDGEVIGPAFGMAYELEHRVARTVRTILGPAILREINRLCDHRWEMARGSFFRTDDGLIALRSATPEFEAMRHLQTNAPSEYTAAKYNDFFAIHAPECEYLPSREDWTQAAILADQRLEEARQKK